MGNKQELTEQYAQSIVSHLHNGADRDIALGKARDVIKEVLELKNDKQDDLKGVTDYVNSVIEGL